mmetsp:Transcript_123094/g.307413  ORF Transcript_123094/g.307413 Transcript_123094/m.307413 type:complete len:270 (+) Transcript_123094:324-1133(+)
MSCLFCSARISSVSHRIFLISALLASAFQSSTTCRISAVVAVAWCFLAYSWHLRPQTLRVDVMSSLAVRANFTICLCCSSFRSRMRCSALYSEALQSHALVASRRQDKLCLRRSKAAALSTARSPVRARRLCIARISVSRLSSRISRSARTASRCFSLTASKLATDQKAVTNLSRTTFCCLATRSTETALAFSAYCLRYTRKPSAEASCFATSCAILLWKSVSAAETCASFRHSAVTLESWANMLFNSSWFAQLLTTAFLRATTLAISR